MDKQEFITKRTEILSKMLDNPDKHGIYPTTVCFNELDALYADIVSDSIMKAIGWAYTDCCIALDNGKDPRKTEIPYVIERAIKDLLEAK